MTRAWRAVAVALVALAAACGAGAGAEPEPGASPERRVLLLSGRDDHGLLAEPAVGLAREPDGPLTDRVPDGTLVAVVEARGEWIRVRTLEGRVAEGWVNDFYLRGTAHLTCGGEQVELVAVDGERVQVRPVGGGAERWVTRDIVAELPDPDCGAPGTSVPHDHGAHEH